MKMAKSVLVIFGFLHLCVSSAIADGAGLEWKILNQQVSIHTKMTSMIVHHLKPVCMDAPLLLRGKRLTGRIT